MKIILDAMGGDHAPEAPVLGAIQAAQKFGSNITLVGRGEDILNVLRENNSVIYTIIRNKIVCCQYTFEDAALVSIDCCCTAAASLTES